MDEPIWNVNPKLRAKTEVEEKKYRASKTNGAASNPFAAPLLDGVTTDEFYAFMQMHNYIFTPDGSLWPAASVNSRIAPITLMDRTGAPALGENGKPIKLKANDWLDKNRPVEQMTWAPGEPAIIRDRLTGKEGAGWVEAKGKSCFNLYRAPVLAAGDASQAGRWVEHIEGMYPEEAPHIIDYLAQRVQRPGVKINHALLLGGPPGIGKDTVLEPVKYAVGAWNFGDTSPQQVLKRFTGFLKSVIVRISEAHDLGDQDRFALYEHLKVFCAAPPDLLRVDEKNLREYYIPNVCGVIMTTNYRFDALYLPPDDRRFFAAWSECKKEDFAPGYWDGFWQWYEDGGLQHVAAFLMHRDISKFNPKREPPKTEAWHAIVQHHASGEERDIADVLDYLSRPEAVSSGRLHGAAQTVAGSEALAAWLKEPKNRRAIPNRLEKCGYIPARNTDAKDGLWAIAGKRQVIYARADLSRGEREKAARRLAK